MSEASTTRYRLGARLITASFWVSGAAHLLRPGIFIPIVPRSLPAPHAIVYFSGAVELLCAAGLSRRASWAPLASSALLLAVWPANVRMALDATGRGDEWWKVALAWVRVPAQLPLIWAVLREHEVVPR